MVSQVNHHDVHSNPILITGGLKQYCLLALTLFSMHLAAMINGSPPGSTDFFLVQIVPTSTCENFIILTTMQLRPNLTLTSRDYQACITRATNVSGCRLMSQFEDPHPACLRTKNAGHQYHHRRTADRIVGEFPYLGSIISNNVLYERNLDNRFKAAHYAYALAPGLMQLLSHHNNQNHVFRPRLRDMNLVLSEQQKKTRIILRIS